MHYLVSLIHYFVFLFLLLYLFVFFLFFFFSRNKGPSYETNQPRNKSNLQKIKKYLYNIFSRISLLNYIQNLYNQIYCKVNKCIITLVNFGTSISQPFCLYYTRLSSLYFLYLSEVQKKKSTSNLV